MELYQLYRPAVGQPRALREYPPCAALRPYVRCFWQSDGKPGLLVVPDTCTDILFFVDQQRQTVEGYYCGLDQLPHFSTAGRNGGAVFAIRFYAWAAALFSGDSLHATDGRAFPAEQHFPAVCRALAPALLQYPDMPRRIAAAEQTLWACLRERGPTLLPEALGEILRARGALSATALARELHISTRQLERLFAGQLGLGPKAMISLMRYQCLWQDLLRDPSFTVMDGVEKYGFTDQAHLLHTFKRYHGMTPAQARALAWAPARKG